MYVAQLIAAKRDEILFVLVYLALYFVTVGDCTNLVFFLI